MFWIIVEPAPIKVQLPTLTFPQRTTPGAIWTKSSIIQSWSIELLELIIQCFPIIDPLWIKDLWKMTDPNPIFVKLSMQADFSIITPNLWYTLDAIFFLAKLSPIAMITFASENTFLS